MKSFIPTLLLCALALSLTAQPSKGKTLPLVELSGKDGGRVTGQDWSSREIKGKVWTLMYVDPDEKDVNEHVEQALKKENFPRDRYGSIAMINAAATWKPDAVIKSVLKGKQKDYPDTIYAMDRNSSLVKKWQLYDDNYHVLTFDKEGRVLYSKAGKLSDADIAELIAIIRANL